MTEDEAHAWLAATVPRETVEALRTFAMLLREESERQNLISAATVPNLWARHIVDSVQLAAFLPPLGTLLDIGSGAGLPGLPLAIVSRRVVTLVEPRRKRADFLARAAERLGLDVTVACRRVEALATDPKVTAVTARAVAPLSKLLPLLAPLGGPSTVYVLPRGRSAKEELESIRTDWQGRFDLVPSITDAESGIIVAREVRRRKR